MSSSRLTRLYPTLDSSVHEIRLLSFIDAGDILSFRLDCFPILQAPPFIALSYTWGLSRDGRHEIRVNGAPTHIRSNLLDALYSIRGHINIARARLFSARRERFGDADDVLAGSLANLSLYSTGGPLETSPERWLHFWIDALCINQTDIDERNAQVALMQNIYASAAFVLVWLDSQRNKCQDSLDFIEETDPRWFAPYIQRDWVQRPPQLWPLFGAAYWSRMWVVQEFVLARSILVAAGSTFLPWSDHMEELFPPIDDIDVMVNEGDDNMILIIQERHEHPRRQEQGFYRSMLSLLARHMYLKCHDPRDRIFALLGLFGARERSSNDTFRADYSMSAEELYRLIMSQASRFLSREGSLRTLHSYVSSALGVDFDYEEVRQRSSTSRARGASRGSSRGHRGGSGSSGIIRRSGN